VLLYAQLRGNNQGIIKITTGGMNRAAAAAPIAVERETRLSALLNGNAQAGMLVLHRAMTMAVEKAKSSGFGIVGSNNTSTSTGALGYYAEQVAKQGLIGIVFAQSPEFVAPHGAKQAIFGTNPIAISIPAEQVGFELQSSSSSSSRRSSSRQATCAAAQAPQADPFGGWYFSNQLGNTVL
jgi:LDH2 family malate/lactate/ureidoglycolate dehydrogenase